MVEAGDESVRASQFTLPTVLHIQYTEYILRLLGKDPAECPDNSSLYGD